MSILALWGFISLDFDKSLDVFGFCGVTFRRKRRKGQKKKTRFYGVAPRHEHVQEDLAGVHCEANMWT